MDTVSHMLLGGAIGQTTLGRRIGNKAVFWGAGIALLPDIDVPIGALMGDAAALTFHRGITHSLLFVTIAAVVIGWLASRIHAGDKVGWQNWSIMLWLVLLSHLAIDAFTSYGIQLLLPFSDQHFAIASISVIDPLYTLPLLITVIWLLLLKPKRPARTVLAVSGITLSSLYLVFTLHNKSQVEDAFAATLAQRDISYQRMFVKPTIFNNVLWRAIVETPDGYLVGFHSRLDDRPPQDFVHFQRNAQYLVPHMGEPIVRDLLRVSDGYYQVVERDGELYFHDLRYGQAFEWLRDDRPHVFTYRLIPPRTERGRMDIETISLDVDRDRDPETARELWNRMMGRQE